VVRIGQCESFCIAAIATVPGNQCGPANGNIPRRLNQNIATFTTISPVHLMVHVPRVSP
jgi:hypothetical protein